MYYGPLREVNRTPDYRVFPVTNPAASSSVINATIDPSQIKEIWALTRRIEGGTVFGFDLGRLLPAMSIHSGFLAVTNDDRIYVIQGGPSAKEPKTLLETFALAAREATHRLGLSPLPPMGYMVPQIVELHEGLSIPGSDPLGQKMETTALAHKMPGKGAEGVIFSDAPGLKTSTMPILTGAEAKDAFRTIMQTAQDLTGMHLPYELSPNFVEGTANCHVFTGAVLERLRKSGILPPDKTQKIYRFMSPMVGAMENGFKTGFSWLDRLLFSPEPYRERPRNRMLWHPSAAPAVS